MPCSQHPSKRRRKESSTEASYYRKADWWKQPDNQSEEETSAHRFVKKSGYVLPSRRKTWSIIWLASGLRELTAAEKQIRSEELEEEFNKLVKQWKEETFFISSLSKKFAHPAHQRIMAMGTAGLPLVLRELQKGHLNWFYALKFMAGRDVAAGIKNYQDARAAWLEWGYKNNYI